MQSALPAQNKKRGVENGIREIIRTMYFGALTIAQNLSLILNETGSL